jgi:broad specificity phosphatase PhoE
MQILLVRHGKPVTSNGNPDPSLCDEGLAQARSAAAFLARSGVTAVVSSPLQRALETAHPTAERLDLDISLSHGFAEADRYGESYRSVEDLRRDPAQWRQFLADPIGFLGGDPVEFKRGVMDALGSVLALDVEKVAVFTHGLPINVILSHVLDLQQITHFVPHYCSITRLRGLSCDQLGVVSVNETAFLEA